MYPKCGLCALEKSTLIGSNILICRRCDTSHHGGGNRWGPPNIPNSLNGRFPGPWRD